MEHETKAALEAKIEKLEVELQETVNHFCEFVTAKGAFAEETDEPLDDATAKACAFLERPRPVEDDRQLPLRLVQS